MHPIKYRWRMWKTYTDKWEKAIHAAIALAFSALMVLSLVNFSCLNVLVGAGHIVIGYALIMKDVWGNAYQQTETLRATGWNVTKALNQWTFVKATKIGTHYYLDPDNPAEDPMGTSSH